MLNLIHAGRRESSHPACLRPFHAAFQFRAATGLMVRSLQDAAVTLLVMGSIGLCAQSNPVLSGDHPDPSVIRVSAAYWLQIRLTDGVRSFLSFARVTCGAGSLLEPLFRGARVGLSVTVGSGAHQR
jgi:hypothetical protein